MLVALVTLIIGCDSFFADGNTNPDKAGVSISSLEFLRKTEVLSVGEIKYISLAVNPSSAKNKITPTWQYDSSIIKLEVSNNNAVITGLKQGQTSVVASYDGHSAVCVVTVSGFSETHVEEPYMYSDTSIIQMSPNTTEKFFVSLYGGTVADIDSYTWTIDNSSVATISPTGQYCQVNALSEGYARVKVTHSKATHPYYVGIYIFGDNTKATYISTDQNIVTLYKDAGEKPISVDLQNPVTENYKNQFQWSVIDGDTASIEVLANDNNAVLTPVTAGQSTLRVTHPSASGGYPLDIIVRVIEIVENVYIEPSDSIISILGEAEQTLSAKLIGLEENFQNPEDFSFQVVNPEVASSHAVGNQIILNGLRNGSTKIIISHPKSEKNREVLIIVEGQKTDAVDTSQYITTTQNYVKTKVGASETAIHILFKGGIAGDEKDFSWDIIQSPKDGTNTDVIRLTTTDGSTASTYSRSNRSVAQSYASGTAYIEPLKEGTATIILSHPKAYYDTEILVKVLDEKALLEEPLYFSGSGIVRFLNSEEITYEVVLNGDKSSSDENDIAWATDNSQIILRSSASQGILSSNATGETISRMSITHPKVESPKEVLVLTADTEDELSNMKAFYADKLYYSINKGSSVNLYVDTIGFSTYDEETGESTEVDFSSIQWTTDNSSVATVEKGDDSLIGIVTGITSGIAKITATYNNEASVTFTVTVYPEGVDIGTVEKTVYFTTTDNVIVMDTNASKRASISPIGMSPSDYSTITWKAENENIATVVANGSSATIRSLSEGETRITVSHPKSENTLILYVRVGSRYVDVTEPVVYISSSTEVVTMAKNSPPFQLDSVLVNGENIVVSDFSFSIDDTAIAEIHAQYATGRCFIRPIKAGIAELTITHPAATVDKKVLVIVGNTEEELSGFKYLSTSQNVVTVAEGSTRTVSVSVQNSDNVILDGYSWNSEDLQVAGITATTAATAVITGNKIGTTRISVRNDGCAYPLDIIVQVVDPIAVAARPYLQVNTSVLTLDVSTSWTTVVAELIGGKEADKNDIQWESSDSSVLQVLGQNGVGKVRALTEGNAYVTVSHSKAPYNTQILVIASVALETNAVISVSENIVNMKPNGEIKQITASLINGNSTDKYNFKWSLDVYDVVDLDYTANTASITPKQQGQVTLTISHPKAAYDQQIIIKVSEYTSFGFGTSNKTLAEGKSTFISMQVPSTSVKTHVQYSSDSPLVAVAQGTSAVCQITALSEGTTVVRAKLIATNTNIVQAEAEMLMSVEKGNSSLVYISAPSTIITLEKGNNRTLSVTLTGSGIIPTDQYNLQWKSTDPSIVTLKGASSTGTLSGQSAYVEALKSGETTITVSHEKSSTTLVLYLIVPGSEETTIKLNKTHVSIEKGDSTEIKATIDGGKTEDYNSITWSIGDLDGANVARLLGRGQTVSVYGLSRGTVTLRAQLPNGKFALCDVTVEDPKSFVFGTQTVRVQPGKERTINYTISPANASLNWVQSEDTYVMFTDNGNVNGAGTVTITGIKDGRSTLSAVTSYGNKATLQVVCAWDYSFNVNKTKLQGEPDETFIIDFTMNPIDSEILIDDSNIADIITENNGDGTGRITVTPTKEGKDSINISARNPATKNTYATKNITLDFEYDNLTLIPNIVRKNGSFSRFENGILYLGDGEEVEINFSVAEDKLEYEIEAVRFENIDTTAEPIIRAIDGLNTVKTITHPTDTKIEGYIIPQWFDVYRGSILQMPFNASWYRNNRHSTAIGGKQYCACTYRLVGTMDGIYYTREDHRRYFSSENPFTHVRNPARDGEWVSAGEFENSYWHKKSESCAGHRNDSPGNFGWGEEFFIDVVPSAIPDESVQKLERGKLIVTVLRNENRDNFEIPLYTEIRNCAFNQ